MAQSRPAEGGGAGPSSPAAGGAATPAEAASHDAPGGASAEELEAEIAAVERAAADNDMDARLTAARARSQNAAPCAPWALLICSAP
eukprot:6735317-Pyramimonas_sp.AAC.1